MTLSHKEFEKRWEQAHRKQHITQKKSSIAPLVHLSVLTILDNYMHQLHKAVDGHALSKEECDAVCEKIAELKPLAKKADAKAAKYLKVCLSIYLLPLFLPSPGLRTLQPGDNPVGPKKACLVQGDFDHAVPARCVPQPECPGPGSVRYPCDQNALRQPLAARLCSRAAITLLRPPCLAA